MAPSHGKRTADPPGIDARVERQRLTFEAIFHLVEKLGTTFDVSKIASLLQQGVFICQALDGFP